MAWRMAWMNVVVLACLAQAQEAADPLGPWKQGVTVKKVSAGEWHSIHSYFVTSPESPDGKWVLFYTSTAKDAGKGEIRVIERATGRERVLATNVTVEDAHRSACQQWVSGGKRVVFHDEREGHWVVVAVDLASGAEMVIARDRQIGWGQPTADLVLLYSPHWNPSECRDLEIYDFETGQTRVAVKADDVQQRFAAWHQRKFGGKPLSVFFPVISPDLKKVFFKMATPGGGDMRSKQASIREGLVVYSLEKSKFIYLHETWGHPAWHPDSRTIVEVTNVLLDPFTQKVTKIPGLPNYRGSHPSASPDGKLVVTDTTVEGLKEEGKDWAVAVSDIRGNSYAVLHRFGLSQGAASWRRSHPHPVFSADGKRVYFNVSAGKWTEVWVAQAK